MKAREFPLKKQLARLLLVCAVFFALQSSVLAQGIDLFTSGEIKDLNKEITERSQEIKKLESKADEFARIIRERQSAVSTLENELALVENRIKKTEVNIERKGLEIEQTNLKIREVTVAIADKEAQIGVQKLQLASLLREIHRQDQRGRIEILMTNDNLSKFFSYIKRLEEVQASLQITLNGVKTAQRDLEIFQHGLEEDKAELQSLALELEIDKQKLVEEKDSKIDLIDETQSSEQEYQKRLAEIRFQQRVANDDINRLQDEIKEKLRQAQLRNPTFVLNPGSLLWPIPNQGITTYYHDPGYPFRHIVGEHSGLDLRTLIDGFPSMGLAVRAPASGVVVKTIHNGRFTGNAVFISHGDMITTYYHLSSILVEVDDYVQIGEVFARTGGAPGHPGAGLSSGPHLHFEVRQNGVPVDPCSYLTPNC
jgi:murein DD-endopeptidase MepM/ murein hydrolase activator NlpD